MNVERTLDGLAACTRNWFASQSVVLFIENEFDARRHFCLICLLSSSLFFFLFCFSHQMLICGILFPESTVIAVSEVSHMKEYALGSSKERKKRHVETEPFQRIRTSIRETRKAKSHSDRMRKPRRSSSARGRNRLRG